MRWVFASFTKGIVFVSIALFISTPNVYARTVGHSPDGFSTRMTSASDFDRNRQDAWIASPSNYRVKRYITVNRKTWVPILAYHEVAYTPGNELTLKPGQFLSEMTWLHAHGFHTINLGQLYAATYYGYKLPPRPIILTFDDGYESVYSLAYPILKKFGYQATVFVITASIGGKTRSSAKYPKLSLMQLRELNQSGLFDIESHTVHHIDLSKAPSRQVDMELRQSAKSIRAWTHHPALFLCYPSGRYNQTDIELAKRNGYLLATTQHYGYANIVVQGKLKLHRIPIHQSETLSHLKMVLSASVQPVTISRH